MYNMLICIKKNRKIIGSIFLKDLPSLGSGLKELREIIDNYNSNLVSLEIPEEILAMKMLQKQNIKGNLPTGLPILMDATYVFLDNVHGNDYEIISGINEEYGFIGIANKDVGVNFDDSNCNILINLDNNIINTDISCIGNNGTILNNHFSFNELEDYIEKIKGINS